MDSLENANKVHYLPFSLGELKIKIEEIKQSLKQL